MIPAQILHQRCADPAVLSFDGGHRALLEGGISHGVGQLWDNATAAHVLAGASAAHAEGLVAAVGAAAAGAAGAMSSATAHAARRALIGVHPEAQFDRAYAESTAASGEDVHKALQAIADDLEIRDLYKPLHRSSFHVLVLVHIDLICLFQGG